MPIVAQQQQRRDTAANWALVNPVLPAGVLGLETDTGRAKMGDGSTTWSLLRHYGVHLESRLTYATNQALSQTVSEAQSLANNYIFIGGQTTTGVVWTLASPTLTAALHRVVVVELGGTSTAAVTVAGAAGDRILMVPGQVAAFAWDGLGWRVAGSPRPTWHGVIYGAYGDCNPNAMLERVQTNGVTGLTATNVSTTVARLAYFRPPTTINVQRLRYYGLGALTNGFNVAVYQASNNTRVLGSVAITTAANAWGNETLTGTLLGGVNYYIAVAVPANNGTTALATMGPTVAATTGLMSVLPSARPGSLALGNFVETGFAQAAVTGGTLGATLTPVAQAAWTGGFPAFWLDANI